MLRPSRSLSLALVLLAACGGSKSDETPSTAHTATQAPRPTKSTTAPAVDPALASPDALAAAFFEAAEADDAARLQELFTDRARASLGTDDSFQLRGESLGAYELGAATIDGDTARVPVTAELDGQTQDMRLLMRRESGAWRMYGFDVSMGGEGWMTFNLESIEELMAGFAEGLANEMAGAMEQAFTDWSQGGSPEDIAEARARFESLQPLTAAAHEAAWKVDVRARNQAGRDVLATLVEGTGVAFDADADGLGRTITLELTGVSRLEAIERACELLDVHPIYPELGFAAFGLSDGTDDETPTIAFEPGPRPHPVAFSGPFLIEVAELLERPPTTTGSLSLAVRALGLAPACTAYQTQMVELCSIDAVEGPGGEDLNGDDGVTFLGTPETWRRYLTGSAQIDLKGLLRGVDRVASVRGSISITIPVAIDATRCTRGSQATAGRMEVAPADWGTYTTFDVGAPDGTDFDTETVEVRLSPLDAEGAPLGTLMTDSMGWGETVRASVQTPEPPEAVDVKVCTVETLAYPFELTDVALEHAAEMPEALEPLGFDGDAPMAAEFVRFTKRDADFPEVELTLHNRSNKGATTVYAEFHYVDASGTELESFQHTLTGTFTMDGVQPFEAGRTETHRTTAFFMPEETESVRVVVTQVEFVDATTWSSAD